MSIRLNWLMVLLVSSITLMTFCFYQLFRDSIDMSNYNVYLSILSYGPISFYVL